LTVSDIADKTVVDVLDVLKAVQPSRLRTLGCQPRSQGAIPVHIQVRLQCW